MPGGRVWPALASCEEGDVGEEHGLGHADQEAHEDVGERVLARGLRAASGRLAGSRSAATAGHHERHVQHEHTAAQHCDAQMARGYSRRFPAPRCCTLASDIIYALFAEIFPLDANTYKVSKLPEARMNLLYPPLYSSPACPNCQQARSTPTIRHLKTPRDCETIPTPGIRPSGRLTPYPKLMRPTELMGSRRRVQLSRTPGVISWLQ
ncbi:hypothetical protein HPB48_022096 [Haemaphysalis longicornis]|uniref:Uncharacterized protein n=1 Tax=Haemaphysalis longicornis TaxID=44386 RepID=A0A9J6FVL2_HAELO|nr:hypothetical protein HPB48_022096 [Haemaphysalis longicornis]